MPQRGQTEFSSLEGQPPYPDWSDEMNESDRDFADQMTPFDRASAIAESAANSARSIGRDLESFARRQPLSALAGALLIGVVLGMLSRRRA
jgi:hypothetical protein